MSIPPSRPPRHRPVSHERQPKETERSSSDGNSDSRSPLVLQCVVCFRISTWYNPSTEFLCRDLAIGSIPSLSTSSHSTTSESSSVKTDYMSDSLLPSISSPDSPHGRFSAFSDQSDRTTPVVTTFPSTAFDRRASSRMPDWTGGELRGVCTTCHRRHEVHPSDSDTGRSGFKSTAPLLSFPRAYDLQMKQTSQYDPVKIISPSGSPNFHDVGPDASPSSNHLSELAALAPTKVSPSSEPKPQLDSYASQSLSVNKVFVKELPDVRPVEPPLLFRSSSSQSHASKPPATVVSLKPAASFHLLESAPPDRLESLSHPINVDSSEFPYKNSLVPAQTLSQSSRKQSKGFGAQDRPSETPVKSEGTVSDSSGSIPLDTRQRGTHLRSLLRQAKIPQSDSDESFHSGRRLPTTVDMWQAAMIATPRDRLRGGDFSWHVYHGTDSPFYQHFRGTSVSTSSLSGKETLRSTSSPSFRDPSPGGPTRPNSPPSEGQNSCEGVRLTRQPSIGRKTTNESPSHVLSSSADLSPSSVHLTPCTSDSLNESQEVLKGSALAKSPRPSASHVSLMTRFANLHQNASKAVKKTQRRPNTASGASECAPVAKASPKPGPRGTPTPNVTCPSALLPSLLMTGTLTASAELRVSNVIQIKRPATATGSGSALSLSRDLLSGRSPLIQKPLTGKNQAYIPTLPTIQGRGLVEHFSRSDGERPNVEFSVSESHDTLKKSVSKEVAPIPIPQSISPASASASQCDMSALKSQSVPNVQPQNPTLPSKRNAFYGTAASAATSDQLFRSDSQRSALENPIRLPSEEFHSKSRNLTLSLSPRPSSSSISPGQKVSVVVKLSSKVKVRKYTHISLMLLGNTTSEGDPQGLGSHEFLRLSYMIHPTPSEEVRVISNSGDPCEWFVELNLPQYATCSCQPGPLPLPSTGTHASGEVSYALQLCADRKQLLSNQESLSVKLNVAAQAEARYQVTTKPVQTRANKGRVPFAGGYLGAIEQISLSHQVYYQSADRLRIGYQLELCLASNSFLPPQVAEQVSRATKVEIHNLIREQSTDCGLKFTDHRSKVTLIPHDEGGESAKWIIKGFLELKAVAQQMKAMKGSIESTPRTPRRAETASAGKSILTSSNGSSSTGGSHVSPALSGTNHSLQQESERQAKVNSSQLFITAQVTQFASLFSKPVEVSSLIGSELMSSCSLRRLGDEMMKRAIMAEKMKRVQEENMKNN